MKIRVWYFGISEGHLWFGETCLTHNKVNALRGALRSGVSSDERRTVVADLEVPQNPVVFTLVYPCRCRCACAAQVATRGELCAACEAARKEGRAPHDVKFVIGICNLCNGGCAVGFEAACSSCQSARAARIFDGVDRAKAPLDDASPRPWKLERNPHSGLGRVVPASRPNHQVTGWIDEADALLIVESVNTRHEIEILPFTNDPALGLASELRALWEKFFGELGAGQASLVTHFYGPPQVSQVRNAFAVEPGHRAGASFDVTHPDGKEFRVFVRRKAQ